MIDYYLLHRYHSIIFSPVLLRRRNLKMKEIASIEDVASEEQSRHFREYITKRAVYVIYGDTETESIVNFCYFLLKKLTTANLYYLKCSFQEITTMYPDIIENGSPQFPIPFVFTYSPHLTSLEQNILEKNSLSFCEIDEKEDTAGPGPTCVLPYLFLGDLTTARDEDWLRRNNISYIVNVTVDAKSVEYYGIKYLIIPVKDTTDQNISDYFRHANEFIDEAKQSERNVLVHCQAGISRSSTIVIAYLMELNNWSFSHAYNWLEKLRYIYIYILMY